MKRKRVGDSIMGTCVDCDKPERSRDTYIVRGDIWRESGMGAWDAGYLHRHCLEMRLGRKLTEDDLLAWVGSETTNAVQMTVTSDYLMSPEFRGRV